MSELFFNITDDIVTGEPVQEYNLSLSNEPAEVQVDPFRTTTISIFDDDRMFFLNLIVVSVSFWLYYRVFCSFGAIYGPIV